MTGLIRKAEKAGLIAGIEICRGAPSVSYLLFADDTLICCEASESAATNIMNILQTYEHASGQKINVKKSTVVFSKNCGVQKISDIQKILNVVVEQSREKYLGVPELMGKSKREVFAYLRDRIWGKQGGLKEQSLSSGGKEMLIKTVRKLYRHMRWIASCFRII